MMYSHNRTPQVYWHTGLSKSAAIRSTTSISLTGETRRVNLNDRGCVRLEDPLKDHAIMCVFTSGNAGADGFEFTQDAGTIKGAVESVSFA